MPRQTALLALAAVVVPMITLTACGEGTQVASVRKGAVPLDQIRLGTPETVFKEAVVSFVQDPNGTFGGKVQYLSRNMDENGGQYLAQVKNEQCFEVDVVNKTPISRELAMQKMQHLLPAEVVAANKPVLHEKTSPQVVDAFTYGKDYAGVLTYTSPAKKEVITVSAVKIDRGI